MPATYAISLADQDPARGSRIIPIAPEVRALRDLTNRFSNKALVLDEGLDPARVESWRAMEGADATAHPGGLAGLCADIAWSFADHPNLQRFARVFVADALMARRTERGRIGPDCLAIVLDGEANLVGRPFARPGRCTGLAPRGKGVTCRLASVGSPSGIFLATPAKADARHDGGPESGGDIMITLRLARPATADEAVRDGAALEAVMGAAAALDERDGRRGASGHRWTLLASTVVTAMDAEIAALTAAAQDGEPDGGPQAAADLPS